MEDPDLARKSAMLEEGGALISRAKVCHVGVKSPPRKCRGLESQEYGDLGGFVIQSGDDSFGRN
jgi:hypothetical protein